MPDDTILSSLLTQQQAPPGSMSALFGPNGPPRMLTLADYMGPNAPQPGDTHTDLSSYSDYFNSLGAQYAQPDPYTRDLMQRFQRFQPGPALQTPDTTPLTPDQRSSALRDTMMGIVGATGQGGGTPSYKPFTGAGSKFLNGVRDEHLAQSDPLPLVGATGTVTPPPHIKTRADFDALVGRYADLAQEGAVAKDWYNESGNAIYGHAGDIPQAADSFAAALARTSPQTDVASNAAFAIKGHNQAMVGDPIQTGRFPNAMGADIEKYYYQGKPISGEKIGPFMGAAVEQWNPSFSHQLVNDGWNMTALEYPRDNTGAMWNGTPSAGQHNFARIVADRATQELEARTGEPWSPKQAQAASWTAIKARTEGTPIPDAGFNFADGLRRNYGQISYESAPGLTTDHMPEYHAAPDEVKQEYHAAVNRVLQDPQGRDLISKHLGLLTGPTVDGPGVFGGHVNPGSQAQVALGGAPGGALAGVDEASRALADTSSIVRGALLRQDAAAWHKPAFVNSLKPAQSNMIDVGVGRPLTNDEALKVTEALKGESGTDFFSPISTPQGFRVMNVPEVSGVGNAKLHDIVDRALGKVDMSDVTTRAVYADGGYHTNDWRENPNGESYQTALSGTGRPHLQGAANSLLATLGPRIAQVEDDFARRYGWTPNRNTRFWEQPGFGGQAPEVEQARRAYWQGAGVPLASMLGPR